MDILSLIEGSSFFGLLYRLSMLYCLSQADSADIFRKGKAVDPLEQGPLTFLWQKVTPVIVVWLEGHMWKNINK